MPLVKRANTVQLPLPPKPFVLSPTGTFDGDDGHWSTVAINIGDSGQGTDGQNFKILPWTSSPYTLLPAETEWCINDCPASRGLEVFQGKQPRGFVNQANYQRAGTYDIQLPYWWSNNITSTNSSSLGTVVGTDNVGTGEASSSSKIFPGLNIYSYIFEDFFLGSLGLIAGSNGLDGATQINFIDRFYVDELIPSRSYGYTAGAYYRNNNKGVTGNLVLGGYDQTRISAEGTIITMPSRQNLSLVLGVQNIMYQTNQDVATQTVSLDYNTGGFSAVIDSALPYLILPDDVCDQFQKQFQLQYDSASRLYMVNASAHEANRQLNGTVYFKVGNSPQATKSFATIGLPYAAFVQQVSFPITNSTNGTQYFPIKKSLNGDYVLGRTFLQEAYIVVDYERQNFTVAPAQFPEPLPSANLISIYNTSYTGLPQHQDSSSGLSGGAIAGIVVGIVLAFVLLGIGAFLFWRKRHNANKKGEAPPYEPPPEVEAVLGGEETYKDRRVSELTGSEIGHSRKPSAGEYYPVDRKPIPPISEMSPESTPAELYSPPQEHGSDRDSADYFSGGAMRRRGAGRGRSSTGGNTPATPIAELPGDHGEFSAASRGANSVSPVSGTAHGRGRSDTSLSTNIDEVLGGRQVVELAAATQGLHATEGAAGSVRPEEAVVAKAEAEPAGTATEEEHTIERRPSHSRGLSDTTIKSDTTAVSQPSADELEQWARNPELGHDRPMSPPADAPATIPPTNEEHHNK